MGKQQTTKVVKRMKTERNERIAVYGSLLALALGMWLVTMLEQHAGFSMKNALLTGGFIASLGMGLSVTQKRFHEGSLLLYVTSIAGFIGCFAGNLNTLSHWSMTWQEAAGYSAMLGLILFWFMGFVIMLLEYGIGHLEPNGGTS